MSWMKEGTGGRRDCEGLRERTGTRRRENVPAGWEDQERGREGGSERAFEGWRSVRPRRRGRAFSNKTLLLVRRLVCLGGADGTPNSCLIGSPSDPGRAVGGERLEGQSDETRKCLGYVGKEVALILTGNGTTEGSNLDQMHSLTWSAVGRRRRKL